MRACVREYERQGECMRLPNPHLFETVLKCQSQTAYVFKSCKRLEENTCASRKLPKGFVEAWALKEKEE